MIKLEKDIETQLRQMVERHGGRCLKWVCPGWVGVPDRIILLPGGHVKFVETKRPQGGRFSMMQRKWKEWLQALGFEHYFVHDEGALATLELIIRDTLGRK
jgi:hypothetical protein